MSEKSEKKRSIREMLDEFEEIIADFDGENLDIDAAIAQYKKAAKLAEEIRARLETEKNKIEVVRGKFGE